MKFAGVVGHDDVKKRLIQAASDRRISHALLFLGPEGSGNLALALAFSQYVTCEDPSPGDSCGKCSSCIKAEKLVHPDITYSFPVAPKEKISKPKSADFLDLWREAVKGNPYISYNEWMEGLDLANKQGIISVEEASDIINRLSLKSVEAEHKIVIVWLAERMNNHAANKVLKILEEPPERTIFLLVSENHEALLSTVISRTQLVKVNRINDKDMMHALETAHGLDKIAARRMMHRADGNYNEALRLLAGNEADTDLNQRFLSWMRHCLKLNVKGITESAAEFGEGSRESQKSFLKHGIDLARECLLINYGDRSMIRLEGKDLEDIRRFAPFVNGKNAEEFISELNNAHYHLERNANSKLLFTDLSLAMHRLLSIR